ncbi:MAG: ATP-grasp domain-containing protein, partial [Epulopiscium sp.]|nr:ATP-grasp domain-containing protein [Candidatus Epulonipiscium sp.]
GYPVLVRPSYVIGGRAMQVVYSEAELREYVKEATSLSTEHPILIDQYIEGKEVEVDAISDKEDILIPGMMEHIERTGVHSGDSICVYPPQTLSQKVIDTLVSYTQKIAKALQVVGLMNIQFVVKDEKVYVIEVNPRASRTVPILSKVTKIPMVYVAVKVILGEKLRDQGYGVGLYNKSNLVAVKAPVFSFQKLNNVDVALTPEMKSTGEVLGVDSVYEKALVKAFSGAGYTFPGSGKILVSLRKKDRKEAAELLKSFKEIGFELIGTEGTAKYLAEHGLEVNPISINKLEEIYEMMKNKEITVVINTPTLGKNPNKNGFKIRTTAEQMKVPCFTSLDTAKAYLLALKTYNKKEPFTYETLDYYM